MRDFDRRCDEAAENPFPASPGRAAAAKPFRRSLRGLDGVNFFIANIQTGFGPFVSAYLTSQAWTQIDIGLVLTVSGIVALVGQIPGGILVDAASSKRSIAALATGAISASAIAMAIWPIFPMVLFAEVLHGAASCLIGPAIAAISLGLVGHMALGERLGRNARYASVGNALAAAAMGACGRLLSNRAVFVFAALLAIPAIISLTWISTGAIDPSEARGGRPDTESKRQWSRLHGIADNRPLLILGGALVMFHLANAAMLPLVGSILTIRSGRWATVLIAACIVVPQIVVAAISPWIGRQAQDRGRHPMIVIGFAALLVRGALFAVIANPYAMVLVQLLDGVSAAVLGVLLPLMVLDVTGGTGRFNAALGVVGTASAIGAALSSTLAGYAIDRFGAAVAFATLTIFAVIGLAVVSIAMPETRPTTET